MITKILLSILIGTLLGILYGLSVFAQKQKAISIFNSNSEKNAQFKIILFSFVRLFVLFLILYCLSLVQNINFILTVTSFIVIFWVVVLKVDPSTGSG